MSVFVYSCFCVLVDMHFTTNSNHQFCRKITAALLSLSNKTFNSIKLYIRLEQILDFFKASKCPSQVVNIARGDTMSVLDSEEPHEGFMSAFLGNIISPTESFINYFQQPVRRFKYHRAPCCASDTINLIPQLVKC